MKKPKKEQKTRETISKKESEELKEILQRNHAEFQNYRKRTEEEKSRFMKLSNEELIKKIIPILDNFELALKHNEEKNEFAQGMELIHKQLIETLEQEGLRKILATGKFNPQLHEVIMVEETNKEPGLIVEELQKGYTLNNKVLRSSKVKITKKKQSEQEVQKNE